MQIHRYIKQRAKPCRNILTCATMVTVCCASIFAHAFAQAEHPSPASSEKPALRDGQHDFDFLFGTWKFHLKRRLNPLTGSNTWVDFDGTAVVRKIRDGRANLDELELDGPKGHIEALTLRLYSPESHQWSLYWATSKAGILGGPPNVGEFKNGRGELFCQDTFNGRTILSRYIWSDITPNSAHFEQSFSDDGGKTWEVNWITDQTRISDASSKAPSSVVPVK